MKIDEIKIMIDNLKIDDDRDRIEISYQILEGMIERYPSSKNDINQILNLIQEFIILTINKD